MTDDPTDSGPSVAPPSPAARRAQLVTVFNLLAAKSASKDPPTDVYYDELARVIGLALTPEGASATRGAAIVMKLGEQWVTQASLNAFGLLDAAITIASYLQEQLLDEPAYADMDGAELAHRIQKLIDEQNPDMLDDADESPGKP